MGVQRVVSQRCAFSYRPEGPWLRDPRLHPRHGWAPHRSRAVANVDSAPGSVRTCQDVPDVFGSLTRLCHQASWRVTDCPGYASHTAGIWCGLCAGRWDRLFRPSSPSSSYRASQPCIVCRLTPQSFATSVTLRPSAITASTALYLCSLTLISLMRGSVKAQPK